MTIKDTHYVIKFHFINDMRCIRPLIEAVCNSHFDDSVSPDLRTKEQDLRSELASIFIGAGWEGDGDIECIFVPPCLLGGQDGWCRIIYHVQQRNNGTSWLAMPNDMKLSLPQS